mmetsp:Transcript_3581/g.8590  ORF Transcript_3581/g.8590 Transcript_3581/m.8590 type:complete len:104 (+) Transcript_3581:247-558(+)
MTPVGVLSSASLNCSKIIPRKIPAMEQKLKATQSTKKCRSFISDATMADPNAYPAKALWASTAAVDPTTSDIVRPMPMDIPSNILCTDRAHNKIRDANKLPCM